MADPKATPPTAQRPPSTVGSQSVPLPKDAVDSGYVIPKRARNIDHVRKCIPLGKLCIKDSNKNKVYDRGELVGIMAPGTKRAKIIGDGQKSRFEKIAKETLDTLFLRSLEGVNLVKANHFLYYKDKLKEIADKGVKDIDKALDYMTKMHNLAIEIGIFKEERSISEYFIHVVAEYNPILIASLEVHVSNELPTRATDVQQLAECIPINSLCVKDVNGDSRYTLGEPVGMMTQQGKSMKVPSFREHVKAVRDTFGFLGVKSLEGLELIMTGHYIFYKNQLLNINSPEHSTVVYVSRVLKNVHKSALEAGIFSKGENITRYLAGMMPMYEFLYEDETQRVLDDFLRKFQPTDDGLYYEEGDLPSSDWFER